MKGLSKEARLSAVRQLRVALAKKMKHELNESPEMEEKEHAGQPEKGPSVSIHVMTGKEVNKKAMQEQKQEEEADPKDKPINNDIAAALKKFMHDDQIIKPKGVAKIVYGGPKVSSKIETAMVKDVPMGNKKPGRPKRG